MKRVNVLNFKQAQQLAKSSRKRRTLKQDKPLTKRDKVLQLLTKQSKGGQA